MVPVEGVLSDGHKGRVEAEASPIVSCKVELPPNVKRC